MTVTRLRSKETVLHRSVTARMVVALLIVAALVVLGNWLYWAGEGGGSPTEFRSRVADAGLTVAWSNNGSRGGDGVVDTDCGPLDISVRLRVDDDSLLLYWQHKQVVLTPETAEAFLRC